MVANNNIDFKSRIVDRTRKNFIVGRFNSCKMPRWNFARVFPVL